MTMIGRITSASVAEFEAGCNVTRLDLPQFGGLVRVQLEPNVAAYGVVTGISLSADGLAQQIARLDQIEDAVLADHLVNRLVSARVQVVVVGYQSGALTLHRLPKRPPRLLEEVHRCEPAEAAAFSQADSLNYLGLLTTRRELPLVDLLLAHLEWMEAANTACGNPDWRREAQKKLKGLLKDQPDLIMRLYQG